MKQKYQELELEITMFDGEDVIITSTDGNISNPCWGDCDDVGGNV